MRASGPLPDAFAIDPSFTSFSTPALEISTAATSPWPVRRRPVACQRPTRHPRLTIWGRLRADAHILPAAARQHHKHLKGANMLERLDEEIRVPPASSQSSTTPGFACAWSACLPSKPAKAAGRPTATSTAPGGLPAADPPSAPYHLGENFEQTLTYFRLPRQHHKHLKGANMLERLDEEIRVPPASSQSSTTRGFACAWSA